MGKNATIIAFDRHEVESQFGIDFGSKPAFPVNWQWPAVWAGPRPWLEVDFRFLQPIPYIVVKQATANGPIYMTYRRETSGGEDRLHGKLSIGIGGHIDCQDSRYNLDGSVDFDTTLVLAAMREMDEEIGVPRRPRVIGFLQDDSDPVGQVHFGIVMVWDATDYVGNGGVFKYEDTVGQVSWRTKEEILNDNTAEIENWTKLALELL